MGHTNSTPNLHLPQFIGSDKPTWLSDVNGAMLAIDAAYGTIQAESSSAATAAAGAVTVAGSAQTAADAAATAAATAGTNASAALSTANNAAGVALQAQTDASSALDIATGDVIVEIVGDGVKTDAQLLSELYAYVSQITPKSVLKYDAAVYHLATLFPEAAAFTRAHVGIDVNVSIATISSSPSSKYAHITTGGSVTITDTSSEVIPSGKKYTLYK